MLTQPVPASFCSPSLQTAHDILHKLCEMLGLQSEEDTEEFGLYADPGKRAQYTVHYLHHLPCMYSCEN